MPGVIFLEHFNCNHLFLCAGCLLMNCVRDNNHGDVEGVERTVPWNTCVPYFSIINEPLSLTRSTDL